MEYRILKGEKCESCKGQVAFFPETDEFRCLVCNQIYNPPDDITQIARKKFWASPRGREIQSAYFQTERGKEALRRHQKSVKGRLTLRRYYYSDKGQEAHQKHQSKVRLFKRIDTWLKANPNSTTQDALAAIQEEDKNEQQPQD